MKLQVENKALSERENVIQEGYDQMRRAKEVAELRALTLEKELHKTKTNLEKSLASSKPAATSGLVDVTGTTATGHPQWRTAGQGTNSQIPTERSRSLDLIAKEWRVNLQRAESEQRRFKSTLQDTEDQIANDS